MYPSALKSTFCLIFSAACLGHAGAGVAQTTAQATLKGAFNERMNPDVVVSGSVVVGVSSEARFDGKSLGSLAVLPIPGLESFCLSVESQDGVYTSRNEYEVPQGLATSLPLRIPYDRSRYLDELADYADQALAMKASAGACDDKLEGVALLPLQRADQLKAGADQLNVGNLRFYVNSIGATDVFISTATQEGQCQPISGRQTSFDHVCRIGLPHFDLREAPDMVVRIERERYGRELPAAEVVVQLGALP